MIAVESKTETAESCVYGDDCPLHAENPPFNAKTLAAVQEARDIMSGKIEVEWQRPPAAKEELKVQLRKMAET
jgi:hypothetical protein